ncbi:MAG: GerAB/ArcD/ProY family transporter [bacterium]|nr:GerAB/ArcD/ProY family transporter [bacterium]
MNNKISSGEMMVISTCFITALFPGITNNLILSISKNSSLLSIGFATILSLIPIFMIALISKKLNSSLFDFLKEKFGPLGNFLNIFLLVMAFITLSISSWLFIDFLISQFLTRNSYYFVAIFISLVVSYCVSKNLETISRTSFVLFLISLVTILISWICLSGYIDFENFKPLIDSSYTNIAKSTFIILTFLSAPLIYIIDLKHKVRNKKNFERKLILSPMISAFLLFGFIFLIIGIYGIDLSSMFIYPIYSLFKKIEILGFIERIENISTLVLIIPFFNMFCYLVYYMKENILKFIKSKNKKKENFLTYFLSIGIPINAIYFFTNYNLNKLIEICPYIFSTLFIVIFIIFIRCLFIKKSK